MPESGPRRTSPKVVSIASARTSPPEFYILPDSGSGGGGDDGWRSSVDEQLKMLHSDVRNLLIGGIGAVLLVGSGLLYGYLSISNQVQDVKSISSDRNADLKVLQERLQSHVDFQKGQLKN